MKKIASLIMVLFLITGCASTLKPNAHKLELYFLNSDGSKMVTETRQIEKTKDTPRLIELAVEALISGPQSPELRAALPKKSKLLGVEFDDGVATVNMNSSFDKGTDIEKLWSRYTLISTICSIDGVSKTKILVDGEDIVSISTGNALGPMGKSDIITDAPPSENKLKTITLYFANADATYLVPEKRTVVAKNSETEEYLVVSELISGPKTSGLYKTITPDVKIRSVETKEGVCFVNLSEEFVTKNTGGSSAESFTVFSIVNSLCNLDHIDKVQFLIEGEKIEVFGQWVFNEPFTEDTSYFAD